MRQERAHSLCPARHLARSTNTVCLARAALLELGSRLRGWLPVYTSVRLFLGPWLGELLPHLPFAFLSDWMSQCYPDQKTFLSQNLLIPTPAGGREVFRRVDR